MQHDQKNRAIEKALAKFSQQLMSNAKWVRLIEILCANTDHVKKIEFKTIHNDQVGQLYLDADCRFGFHFWHNGFEGHHSFGGWLLYKEIEWLIFPKMVNLHQEEEQDIQQILQTIKTAGIFHTGLSENELRLYCYRQ